MFALVDCNNFYVSCERAFRPDLEKKPVMVLSNNDGIVIARSNEVKQLGIPMGAPVFKYKNLIKKHDIRMFSCNFALYGDMSARVMDIISRFSPNVEIYSIDEAFLLLDGINGGANGKNLKNYGALIRKTIKKWTGVPVSVGIAMTKTLAKAANEIAKKNPQLEGVLDFSASGRKEIDSYLKVLDVSDVWGIGRVYSQWLKKSGIETAYGFKYLDQVIIKKKMGVSGLRILAELHGVSCIYLEQVASKRQTIICGRSFEKTTDELEKLEQLIARFASRAAKKLRSQSCICGGVMVFLRTNYFAESLQYSNGKSLALPSPTADNAVLIRFAKKILKNIYKRGYNYKKMGVMLFGIVPDDSIQANLFEKSFYDPKRKRLMAIVDRINRECGRETLSFLAAHMQEAAFKKPLLRTPRYTTRWEEILKIR